MIARWAGHGWRGGSRSPVTFLLFSVLCVAGLGSCSNSPAPAGTVWLCRPGLAHDPCTASLAATVVSGTGNKQIIDYEPASRPAIDCFYVYPLVSLETTPDTTLRIDPQETAIAELEASPFSRVCRVFAPDVPAGHARASSAARRPSRSPMTACFDAWRDYLAHYNDGRGVVLIGHSEGADELDQLISGQIDNNPGVRRLLVSAILTGGNLTAGANGSGPLGESVRATPPLRRAAWWPTTPFPSHRHPMRYSAGLSPGPERRRATGGVHEPGRTRGRNRNARVCVPGPAAHAGGGRQRDGGNDSIPIRPHRRPGSSSTVSTVLAALPATEPTCSW